MFKVFKKEVRIKQYLYHAQGYGSFFAWHKVKNGI